jgi:hypothetical protein
MEMGPMQRELSNTGRRSSASIRLLEGRAGESQLSFIQCIGKLEMLIEEDGKGCYRKLANLEKGCYYSKYGFYGYYSKQPSSLSPNSKSFLYRFYRELIYIKTLRKDTDPGGLFLWRKGCFLLRLSDRGLDNYTYRKHTILVYYYHYPYIYGLPPLGGPDTLYILAVLLVLIARIILGLLLSLFSTFIKNTFSIRSSSSNPIPGGRVKPQKYWSVSEYLEIESTPLKFLLFILFERRISWEDIASSGFPARSAGGSHTISKIINH